METTLLINPPHPAATRMMYNATVSQRQRTHNVTVHDSTNTLQQQ
jgi:hypothetical protein